MAIQTLPQDGAGANVLTLRINAIDNTLTGRSVEQANSLFLADAHELPFGDYGTRNIPKTPWAGDRVQVEVRTLQWMPYFDKGDTLVIDLSREEQYGDIVLAGERGGRAYICRYERGDRDETRYTLYDGLNGHGEKMNPLPVWGVAIEHIQTAKPEGFEHFTVVRRLREGGKSFAHDVYLGAADFADGQLKHPLPDVWGDLHVTSNLGEVSVGSSLYCSGTLHIGQGTTLAISGKLAVTGMIQGGGSLKAAGAIEADSVLLDGDLRCDLSITLNSGLRLGGNLQCEDPLTAKAVWVTGNAKVSALIETGVLSIDGNADLAGVQAGDVECGGNLRCDWWLESEGQIDVHGDLYVAEELRASRSITVAGTLDTGGRILAGLMKCSEDGVSTDADRTVTCKTLLSNTLAYGILVEREPNFLNSIAREVIQRDQKITHAHLGDLRAQLNQRYVDTKDELFRDARDVASELSRIRNVEGVRSLAIAQTCLNQIEQLARHARVVAATAHQNRISEAAPAALEGTVAA